MAFLQQLRALGGAPLEQLLIGLAGALNVENDKQNVGEVDVFSRRPVGKTLSTQRLA